MSPRTAREGALRIGLAGLGTMGRNHLRNLVALDGVVVCAIADPAEAALASAAVLVPDAVAMQDPMEMLGRLPLDALIVATPTTSHHAIATAALDQGIAVLVEKPIAATVVEARAMIAAAGASGSLLQVGHIERFNPAVQALTKRLRAGMLSRIFSVRTVRAGPLPERIRDVGVAIDLATHDIDLICHIVGEQPERVAGGSSRHVHTSHEDLLYGLLSFPGGTLGLLDANWLTPQKQRRLTVLGEEGMIEVDYLRQTLIFTRSRAALHATYLDGFAPTFEGDAFELPVRQAEPLRRELEAFVTAVRGGRPSPVSGADGLRALLIAELLLEASVSGGALPVPVAAA